MEKRVRGAKILLLTTGGTIASTASEGGFVPSLSGEELLSETNSSFNELNEYETETLSLFSKDSSNMHPKDWLVMAEGIRQNAQGKDAVVLLHGTDTLAWTSSSLSYLLRDFPTPVVLTGSMLPPGESDSDAPDNIAAAFRFASRLAADSRKGVSVAFDGLLIHGPRATKIDSHRKRAFVSVDYPLLGKARGEERRDVFLTGKIPNFSSKCFWDETPVFETEIALVPLFPGMRAASLDALVATASGANANRANANRANAPKAVVLEGYGLGGVPYIGENLLPSIEKGIQSGIPFVLRTQSPFGGTDPSIYEVGRKALDLGVLSAGNMTREALMTKLMLLLPLFKGQELAASLGTNFCDEIPDEIPEKSED
ncbi:MAG: asparaginase [Synergistaceae bacterium]|jgi:L-asparaginase|nr:asparaginase [Synergistaceae bacterium]